MKSKLFFLGLVLSVSLQAVNLTTPEIAYTSALENSPKLKSAKLQYDSKAENIQEVYAKLYPQLNFSISYSQANYEINELQIRSDYDIKEKSTDFNLSLNQVLYDHSIYTKLDVEKSRLKLYKLDFESKKFDLISEVLSEYMKVMDSKNKIALLESNYNFKQENFNLVSEKYKLNLVNKMDYLESIVDTQKTKIALEKEKIVYKNLVDKFKEITKLETINMPNININLYDSVFIQKIKKVIKENNNLERNIQMMQAETALELSKNEVDNAYAGHYPTLNFNLNYTEYKSNDATSDYENYGKAMVKLNLPLYQGGAVSSRVLSKKLIKNAAMNDLEVSRVEENTRLKESINNLQFTLESLDMYKNALESAEVYIESVEVAYSKGLKSIVDLYEAKNKLFDIKYEYMKTISELSTAYVNFLIVTNNLKEMKLLEFLVEK